MMITVHRESLDSLFDRRINVQRKMILIANFEKKEVQGKVSVFAFFFRLFNVNLWLLRWNFSSFQVRKRGKNVGSFFFFVCWKKHKQEVESLAQLSTLFFFDSTTSFDFSKLKFLESCLLQDLWLEERRRKRVILRNVFDKES